MNFELAETLDILERTPRVLDALVRGTGHTWTTTNEGPDTWSAIMIVGHLVHGEETDWVTRARIILEHGDAQPFEPFDRFAQFRRFEGWSLDRLLDRVYFIRCQLVHGAATHASSLNRTALRRCKTMLGHLLEATLGGVPAAEAVDAMPRGTLAREHRRPGRGREFRHRL